jgi:uncharacterized protein YqfB (UPF0267 family)
MSGYRILKFSSSWNGPKGGKLLCVCYTTIRNYDAAKFRPGARFQVWLNEHYMHNAEVVSMKRITAETLNDWQALLDTGYDAATLREKILAKMYPNNLPSSPLSWVLLRQLKEA